jgi:hypothetical protein
VTILAAHVAWPWDATHRLSVAHTSPPAGTKEECTRSFWSFLTSLTCDSVSRRRCSSGSRKVMQSEHTAYSIGSRKVMQSEHTAYSIGSRKVMQSEHTAYSTGSRKVMQSEHTAYSINHKKAINCVQKFCPLRVQILVLKSYCVGLHKVWNCLLTDFSTILCQLSCVLRVSAGVRVRD